MARITVGILRGGSSSEYESSVRSGAAVMNALPEDRYDTRDIFIDKNGLWHSRGMPAEPARALAQVDVVYNALHGGAGEDGTVQRILERAGIPYTGSKVIASNASSNKIIARELLSRAGINIPRGKVFTLRDGPTGEMAMQVFQMFPPPYVVKPPSEGSSIGIIIADTLPALPDAIGDVLDAYGVALIEEFILGSEATVGVIENFRKEPLYALPPAEIVLPKSARYLDKDVLQSHSHRLIVPSNFSFADKRALADAARAAHRALGMAHFSNVDMILTRRGPYVLEANASPALHDKSPMHHMLHSVGASVGDFAEHILAQAQH